jgi:hypothetical protein
MALNRKLLGSYLNDHLAGATVGRELTKRTLGSNRGNEFGEFLEGLLVEIEEDRETLLEVMRTVGVGQDRVKAAGALVAERLGRLKLNGSIVSYSPLSRLVELEGLSVGIDGKRSLWRSLAQLEDPALSEFDFWALEARAETQREGIETLRLEAARIALQEA